MARGRLWTPEERAKQSAAMLRVWDDPLYRATLNQHLKCAHGDDDRNEAGRCRICCRARVKRCMAKKKARALLDGQPDSRLTSLT
jgi:hypothetical protein